MNDILEFWREKEEDHRKLFLISSFERRSQGVKDSVALSSLYNFFPSLTRLERVAINQTSVPGGKPRDLNAAHSIFNGRTITYVSISDQEVATFRLDQP